MPRYCFVCESCGARFEQFMPIREATWEVPCTECGCPAGRDLQGERPAVQGDLVPYVSEAMGICPGEKGLPGESYDPDGGLRIQGKAHKRAVMRRLGYEEKR